MAAAPELSDIRTAFALPFAKGTHRHRREDWAEGRDC
jgi:hypothetical protein